jgi:hypothetical protein
VQPQLLCITTLSTAATTAIFEVAGTEPIKKASRCCRSLIAQPQLCVMRACGVILSFTCSLTHLHCNALLFPNNFASPIRSATCSAPLKAKQCEQHSLAKQLTQALLPAALSVALCFGTALQPAHALNEQQQVVAEVWRTVDRLYLDRTFNKVDWFDLRQQTLKAAAAPMSEAELNKVITYTAYEASPCLIAIH